MQVQQQGARVQLLIDTPPGALPNTEQQISSALASATSSGRLQQDLRAAGAFP